MHLWLLHVQSTLLGPAGQYKNMLLLLRAYTWVGEVDENPESYWKGEAVVRWNCIWTQLCHFLGLVILTSARLNSYSHKIEILSLPSMVLGNKKVIKIKVNQYNTGLRLGPTQTNGIRSSGKRTQESVCSRASLCDSSLQPRLRPQSRILCCLSTSFPLNSCRTWGIVYLMAVVIGCAGIRTTLRINENTVCKAWHMAAT